MSGGTNREPKLFPFSSIGGATKAQNVTIAKTWFGPYKIKSPPNSFHMDHRGELNSRHHNRLPKWVQGAETSDCGNHTLQFFKIAVFLVLIIIFPVTLFWHPTPPTVLTVHTWVISQTDQKKSESCGCILLRDMSYRWFYINKFVEYFSPLKWMEKRET